MANSRARITQLDGLRAIAILMVFAHHLFEVKLAWMGVDLFFVLSGFLITGILFNQKGKGFGPYIGSFYEKRARRILPPYVVVLIITGFIFGFGYLRYWYFYIGGMNFLTPLQIPMHQSLPLWSLAVEEQFYLVWPIAVYFLSRKHLIALSAALLFIAPALRFLCTPLFPWHWEIYELLPFRIDTLAAGALIALLWPELQKRLEATGGRALRTRLAGASVIIALISVAFLIELGRHGVGTATNSRLGNTTIYSAVLLAVTGLFLIVLLGFGKRLLSSWAMVWIGRISYSIYLFHLTAILLVERYVEPRFGHQAFYLASAAFTILYALVMWFLVESPLSKVGQSRPKVLITEPAA